MQNTLDEYKDWLGEDNVDSDTQTKFDNGLKILKDIEEFENDIVSIYFINVLFLSLSLIPHILLFFIHILEHQGSLC